jgi:hypothetical protein
MPYIQYTLKNGLDDDRKGAIDLLILFGEEGVELLKDTFYHASNQEDQANAARGLAVTSDRNLKFLESALQEIDGVTRQSAIRGIRKAFNFQVNDKRKEDLLHVVKTNLAHTDPVIRLHCLYELIYQQKLSNDEIAQALQDKDSRIRFETVSYLKRGGIISTFAALFVHTLEDRDYTISQYALEVLDSPETYQPETVASAILSELIVRSSGLPGEGFNAEIVTSALKKTFEYDPQLRGRILHQLRDLSFQNTGSIRNRCIFTAKLIDETHFIALVNERATEDPVAAQSILGVTRTGWDVQRITAEISATEPSDVQRNAANQIKLLDQYHEDGLRQAKTSFMAAIVTAILGFISLILAFGYLIATNETNVVSIATAIGSVLLEFISGALFYLYNQTRTQLTYYHRRMNQIQRFLLANSVIESMEGSTRDEARRELAKQIANADIQEPEGSKFLSGRS